MRQLLLAVFASLLAGVCHGTLRGIRMTPIEGDPKKFYKIAMPTDKGPTAKFSGKGKAYKPSKVKAKVSLD
jgi:hypothetical protein